MIIISIRRRRTEQDINVRRHVVTNDAGASGWELTDGDVEGHGGIVSSWSGLAGGGVGDRAVDEAVNRIVEDRPCM